MPLPHRCSGTHLLSHPSPAVVLPSSHSSLLTAWPSPQTPVHDPPAGSHIHPSSTMEQSLLQPSPPVALPSSHASKPATTMPSPQTTVQALGIMGPSGWVHVHPFNVWQSAPQPRFGSP